MITWTDYCWYRQAFGRVASFAHYGDPVRDGGRCLRASTPEEFRLKGLDSLVPKLPQGIPVFLALNFSGTVGTTAQDFESFHMTHNDTKLASLVEQFPTLRGAYITDLFKNFPESSSSEVLSTWKQGKISFDPSALYREMNVMTKGSGLSIFPILLGKGAWDVFTHGVGSTNIGTTITHYSAQGALGGVEKYIDSCRGTLLKHGFPEKRF